MDLHRTTFFSSSVCNFCIVNVLVQFRRIPFRSAACQKTHTQTHTDFCDANQTKPNKRKKMSTMHMLDHSGRKQRNIKNGQTSEPGICDQSVMIAGKGEENCVAEMKRTRKKEVHCASFNCVFFAFQIWAFTFFFGSVLCIVFDSWRELFFHMHTHTEYGKRWWATKRTTWIKCVHKRGKNCDILWSCKVAPPLLNIYMYIFIRSTFYVSCWAKKTFYLVLINRNDHISVHKVLRLANITVQFGLYAYGGAVNTQVEHICV